jgi:multiple sugar transport system substrate-binding protein
MKTRKVLALLLSTLMIGMLFIGCNKTKSPATTQSSSASDAGGPPQTVSFYGGWTSNDLNVMQSLVTKFNSSQNSIKVQLTSLQWTQIYAKFITDVAAGKAPDILVTHSFEMPQFANMGVLDSNAIKSFKLNQKDYVPVSWNGTIYKGTQYSVPLDMDVHGLFYNKDMFTKAGITTPPATGADLIADAQKLTVDANGKHPTDAGFDPNNVKVYGLGFLNNYHVFYQTIGLLAQQGNDPFGDNSITFDPTKTANAFQFFEDLIYKYKVSPKGESSPINDFQAGTIAMMIDGGWQLCALASSTISWDVAPYPQIFGQKGVWGAASQINIPLNSNRSAAELQATETFVKWLSNDSADWALSGHLPANEAAVKAASSLIGRQAFISELSYAHFLPAYTKSTQLFSSVAPSPILTASQEAVLNDQDPKTIVSELQSSMNSIMQ